MPLYRKKIFNEDAIIRRKAIFSKVSADFGSQLVEVNGKADNVHLLVNYPPKHSVSSLVYSSKDVSSRLLRLERPDLASLLERSALVTVVLCCQLRRSFYPHPSQLPRTAASGLGPYIPALKREVFTFLWIIAARF